MKKIILMSCFLLSCKLIIFCTTYIPENINAKYNHRLQSPTPLLKDRTEFIKALPKNKIIAEIGVQAGTFSEDILKYAEPEHLYLIDCWSYQDPKDYNDSANLNNIEQEKLFQAVKQKFANDPRITIIKAFSPEAARLFKDNFFDWIYLDANHSYESVKSDLEGWFNKVKPGGIIAGHDYVTISIFGVVAAVNEFIDKNNLKLGYLSQDYWSSYGILK